MWYRRVRNWYVKEAWWFWKRFGRFEMLRRLASGIWRSKGEGSGGKYEDSDIVRARWYSRLTKVCQVTSWRPSIASGTRQAQSSIIRHQNGGKSGSSLERSQNIFTLSKQWYSLWYIKWLITVYGLAPLISQREVANRLLQLLVQPWTSLPLREMRFGSSSRPCAPF